MALVRGVDGNSLDTMIHRHIGRYRAMLTSQDDTRVQTHLTQVIKTLEKHVKMDHDDPQLGSLHEKYAKMCQGNSSRKFILVSSQSLTLSSQGVFVMLKDFGINKYLVSKDEVLSIFRFASQSNKSSLNKHQFMTFILNLARVMFSRPPHNVPLDECLNLFIVKYLPKRIPTLRPIRAPSRPDQSSIFRLTSHPPPTMQHFSSLLRPLPSASSRPLLRPLNTTSRI